MSVLSPGGQCVSPSFLLSFLRDNVGVPITVLSSS